MFLAQFLGDGEPEAFGVAEWTEKAIQAKLDSAADLGGIRAWNSKFDLGFTHRHGFKLPPEHLWHDGMLMAHIVDERFSSALKVRGERLFGSDERDDEQQVKDWLAAERRRRRKESKETGEEYVPPTYADVPDEIMIPYGIQDVVLQRKVCEVYENTLSTDDTLRDVYELERKVMAALFWMEQRGVPVDRAAAAKFETRLLAGMDAQEDKLRELAGDPDFNPNAPQQVAAALERRGVSLKNVPTTPTGQKQMNIEVLENINDELAAAVLTWKSNSKTASTYLGPMLHGKEDKVWGRQGPFIADDERIHPNFRQLGAITGRMSCIASGELVDAPRDLVRYPNGIPIENIRQGDMVYSFDAEGNPRPAAVTAIHPQGRKAVMKLIYRRRSGGSSLGSLKATPDHRVALEDGTWRRMDELKPGDKLRFLSRTTYRGTAANSCYASMSWPGTRAVPEHRLVKPGFPVVHHEDRSGLNNHPDNLVGMSWSAHMREHGGEYHPGARPCPYPADVLAALLEDGILAAIQTGRHDHTTLKRWADELGVDIPDARRLHPVDPPGGAAAFSALWEQVGVRGVMAEYGCGTYTAYRWKELADADTNHEVVCVVDEGQEVMTYDLTIDGEPNFVVNEISVHNCSDPNMQNWPRDDLSLRYLVRAEPGKKLICCDLDAIEMRLFAAFAGKGILLDQVKRPDGDPHSHTAQMVGITDRRRPDGSVTAARQQAKVFNFSMIYGGGVNTVASSFGVSKSRAKEMINRFHQAYPEIGSFQNRIRAKLEDQGYVKTPWGRRHRADSRKPIHQQAYKFPNKLVQGTAADLLKDAIAQIHAAGIEMILPVHDEIIAHVDEADAEEAARIIEKCMTDHPRISNAVPLSAEAQIVDRWSDAKQPGFVPAYIKEA